MLKGIGFAVANFIPQLTKYAELKLQLKQTCTVTAIANHPVRLQVLEQELSTWNKPIQDCGDADDPLYTLACSYPEGATLTQFIIYYFRGILVDMACASRLGWFGGKL